MTFVQSCLIDNNNIQLISIAIGIVCSVSNYECVFYLMFIYKLLQYLLVCGIGASSMTGLFTMLIGVATVFAVVNFGPKLYAKREEISVKKIKTALQQSIVYSLP
jgi:hypothetical protein